MLASASSFGSGSDHGGTRQRRQVDKKKPSTEIAKPPNEKSNIEKIRRRKYRPVWKRLANFGLKHRWPIPLIPLLVLILTYLLNPTESDIVHHFIFLSYKNNNQYGKGLRDIAFVLFYTIVLSFTRELIMHEFLRPLSLYYGITSKRKQDRFMEQMYTVIYFGLMGPLGLYIMRYSAPEVWYFNTSGMYASFPHLTLDASFKAYYLFQAAYWGQQALVMILRLEKPRKDFKELVIHHVVTLALIALSYRFHFTRIGIAVYVTHDISDFFLAISKSLHYTNSPLVAPAFGICIIVWVYLRHYLNLRILISLLPGGAFQTVGPYELNWEMEQYKCWISNVITFGLLACLQALNLFWLYCLGRSAYRFVVHRVARDDRSEDEDEVGYGDH
ncbi:longevity assurance factor, putative [Talaromyces stipitatus ATCC 10500]|uniref:Longevity assurance factor, putative n=1 Tax=Talaromyces stipitatus (strain ATCC 10500 / CBS 375.48 / QM 6759 / NRRL 1006) TaxID=441959 RepID=B8M154_TALSN|nr:longevity assurance factor, putative [Talaromyces stipitatus ATCC 10500]EED20996.1 longevity assurance factor, putative [Talaromyces stipitatus ATCC 10500]